MTSPEDLLDELRRRRTGDLPTHGGRTLAYVFDSGLDGVDALAAQAHALASSTNGLDPTAFPSMLRCENELVGEAAALLGGGAHTAGTVTSGGTESCLLAVLAAREARPDVPRPRMVLPDTAHPAFDKAAHYFGMEAVRVPVDPVTLAADPSAMAAALDDRTVLVVVSAPSYAHGVLDPVAPVAAAAAARGIRCHVDACIGGWVLPHLDAAPFDLSVPGVTSIAVDLHKYAYCPKGTSVLLHADAALRRPQYFASAAWPGYTMVNPTMQSTRSGGPVAAAWAVVRHLGREGYAELARAARRSTLALAEGVDATDGLRVLVAPDSTLLALTASDGGLDVFTLADEMLARGWYLQPQFGFGPSPANLHLTVTAALSGQEDALLADLRAAVDAARAAGPVVIDDGIAAVVAALDPDALTPEEFGGLLAAAGLGGGGGLPTRMAPVNALLALAPPRLRERLTAEFFGRLQQPVLPAEQD
ncbi:pyridoxal phosphate-dependent decarboxylase family protein [Pseudonocardia broussonetiae]|uniref:Aspartate aminotransferase family protein n=1 Tax=Pseudonocardia broussonetiae TaxID=2736640 RepID=A0A6M6JM24_9PSEU|nr:aminotransferase class V-fold PLP-dependent enzyme [Pseudonocardia broussonetiae]QJY47692.1 aspartate aminotransferase family protein [Pseudonocardia broussonetiae]